MIISLLLQNLPLLVERASLCSLQIIPLNVNFAIATKSALVQYYITDSGILVKIDPNGRFEMKITQNGGFLPPLMTPTFSYDININRAKSYLPLGNSIKDG